MRKIFLSHRSTDKFIVEIVAKKLGNNLAIYDAQTFQESSKTLDEIIESLNGSDIFVYFISENALKLKPDFDWVKYELDNAKKLLDRMTIKTFIPIVIDRNIDHNDVRIPCWIKENYNLRPVTNTDKMFRIIKSRLLELTWEIFPNEKKRKHAFAGRSEYVGDLEARLFNGHQTPISIIASGMNRVGRKSIIRYTLCKTGIIPDNSYEPITLTLKRDDSVEDLIIKLLENGNTDHDYKISDLNCSLAEKINIAAKVISQAVGNTDVIFITDEGCIINTENVISDWFTEIIEKINKINRTVIAVASKFNLRDAYKTNDSEYIYYFKVDGLNKVDKTILLNQLTTTERINIRLEESQQLLALFKGFPEQVYFAVKLLKEKGFKNLMEESYQIIEYNSERVFDVIKDLKQEELDFLRYLSEYDYISYENLTNLFENASENEVLHRFINMNICESYGGFNEFISVEQSIRDYIQRRILAVPEPYKKQITKFVTNFVANEDINDSDSYYIGSKHYIINSDFDKLDDRFILPSTYLKAIIDLYNNYRNRYKDIAKLAYKILDRKNEYDVNIEREVRYWLCMSLAKTKDSRFMEEIHKVIGPEHNYIFGYFYRINGRIKEAEERLNEALKIRKNFPKAKTELVTVYLIQEEYEKALSLAKEVYTENTNNIFTINSYFRCLIRTNSVQEGSVYEKLLSKLRSFNSSKANEMYYNNLAQYNAFYLHNLGGAINAVDDGLQQIDNKHYLLLTKLEIYIKFRDTKNALIVYEQLIRGGYEGSFISNTLKIKRAQIYMLENKISSAEHEIDTISNFSTETKTNLKMKITERRA